MTFENVPMADVMRYWDSRPCNIKHSKAAVGTRQYFEEVDARKAFVEPHIASFAQYERWAGKRVLEIGCGIGTDTQRFAEAGAHVTAIDLSPKSVEIARRRSEVFGYIADIGVANAEFLDTYMATATKYDLVYSFGVIHHTPNPERVVRQMRKFVAEDGVCKIMVYNRWSWKSLKLVGPRFWAFDRLVARGSEAETGCPVTYTYSRHSGRKLLEQGGFKLTDLAVDHIFPYRVSDYVNYKYVKTLPVRMIPADTFHSIEHLFGWHLMMTGEPC